VGLNRVNEEIAELDELAASGYIEDVLGVVKSGKEATVYCCRGGPYAGRNLVAAKVYRARMVRQFANAAAYNAGRLRGRDGGVFSREARAMQKNARLGRELSFGKWVADEYETLRLLHRGGASVPAPITVSERIVLMEYIGDEDEPAPALNTVALDPGDAGTAFEALMRDVETMLACDRVHADLSPYNVLWYEGRPRVIDVPQAVDARFNPNALSFLERDVERICQWAAAHGVARDAWRTARALWERYIRGEL